MNSPPRSIPPSLDRTKRNPLGICRHAVDGISFATPCFYRNRRFEAVMAVTLQCDGGYNDPRGRGADIKRNVWGAKRRKRSETSLEAQTVRSPTLGRADIGKL